MKARHHSTTFSHNQIGRTHQTRRRVAKVREQITKWGGIWETYNFPDGRNDDRWYSWCIENWGHQVGRYVTGIEVQDYDTLEISFNTAWSPPEGVVEKLREKFPELTFQCFYDEPGCEIAGYY